MKAMLLEQVTDMAANFAPLTFTERERPEPSGNQVRLRIARKSEQGVSVRRVRFADDRGPRSVAVDDAAIEGLAGRLRNLRARLDEHDFDAALDQYSCSPRAE